MAVKSGAQAEVVKEPTATEGRRRRFLSDALSLVREVTKQPISMLAKQAAYSLLYAIPSILIVVVSLASIVDKQTDLSITQELEEFIDEQVPSELQPLLHSLVDEAIADTSESAATITALVSLGIAIWSGAGAVGSLMYGCNLVYDVRETRPWIQRMLLRLGIMVVGGIGLILGFVFFTFGQRIGEWVDEKIERHSILIGALTSSRIWSLALIFLSLLLIYRLGPNVSLSVRWLIPGALAATLALAITFTALDFVFQIFNPGSAYGAAGSVLVLLWTLYLMSFIVVCGAVVNAIVARRFDHKMIDYLAGHPERHWGVVAP